jgi:hypothetical protein
MVNQESMQLLTKLEELNGRLFSINIALLAELGHFKLADSRRALNPGA